ncbi:metalloendopeptidase OMA1, mitochondrial-like [Macrobrachium nipponense]|uniref:metalloendopeptidase OMA1, mitochondrial-like n=1 Tax=Macrobrachium nipponense TaxID=159736 RepID=UPI0030C7CE6E
MLGAPLLMRSLISRGGKRSLASHHGFFPPCQSPYPNSWRKMDLKPRVPLYSPFTYIHTSSPRNLHPVVTLLVVKPLTRVAAAVSGWWVKRWWKRLPNKDRIKIKEHFQRHKLRYGGVVLFLIASGYGMYVNHVTANPYTGRKRFMIYNRSQLELLAQERFDSLMAQELEGKRALGAYDEMSAEILGVVDRLLKANSDIREVHNRNWTLNVFDDEEFFVGVYSSGQIVCTTGSFEVIQNEHQLAHVLAHEMSHVILEHHAESASYGYLVSGLITLPMALICAVLPSEVAAGVTGWVFSKIVDMVTLLPHSREQEAEADAFGLKLMAKACYDVRESSVFWGSLSVIDDSFSGKWFDTHPSSSNRQALLDGQMCEAMMLRLSCKCPELPARDPRHRVWQMQRMAVNPPSQSEEKEDVGTNSLPDSKEGTTEGCLSENQEEEIEERPAKGWISGPAWKSSNG